MKIIPLLMLLLVISGERMPLPPRINRGLGGDIVRATITERLFDLTLAGATSPPIRSVDVKFQNIDARPPGAIPLTKCSLCEDCGWVCENHRAPCACPRVARPTRRRGNEYLLRLSN